MAFLFTGISTNAASDKNVLKSENSVALADFLDDISETHKVFFTYNPVVISGANLNPEEYRFNSLGKIINRLESHTNFDFEYLGNKYYVVNKKKVKRTKVAKVKTIKAINFSTNNDLSVLQNTVTGLVSDQNGEPLAGVNIVEKGTSNGTSTDFDGNYEITVGDDATLVFSYIGFSTVEESIGGRSTVNAVLSEGVQLAEAVVIGSRNPNRTATESTVPVDVIDIKELNNIAPQVNLNQILNYVAPSFTSNTQTISDGTDHVDPASLRGLGPDQVLVLINGKRRHTSSLVNVNGTFGRGSVGTDLNAIPASAIQRIEVLRDGAAAQYGSDAIAGVINIVLNKSINELTTTITTGANFAKHANNQTGGVDGATTNFAASYGLGIGERGGFINFSGDFDVRQDYSRMKEWEGSIFNNYNVVERVANADGYNTVNLLDDDVADVIQYSQSAGINLNGATTKEDLRTVLGADATDSELSARGQQRSDYNMRVGQSAVRGGRFFANFALPLDDNGTEIYSFAGISSRTGNSAGFYRLPNQSRTFTPAYINGFLPEINSAIQDKSFSAGIKGKIGEWNVDFSNTYGKNAFDFTIGNTFNASLQSSSPTTFDAGGFSFAQNTTNLDINQFYDDIMDGLNVAFGGEYRVENYEIVAGEPASYQQYTADGTAITSAAQSASVDFFGNSRPGGSQVFPGFGPKNELSRGRSSVAGYIDVEADFSERFLTSFATRFENYSDFGSTINFKLASRYKISDNVNVRAAFNTGFRAPSLHQINFNATATIFDQNGNPQEVGTFSNDSRAANLLGIPQLKQETSSSVSAGITAKMPDANLTLTVDGYYVRINDRVVYTGQFSGPGTGTELDNLLSQANATAAAFFANAIDTESSGVDVVLTHKATLSDKWRLKSDLAGTFSKTRKVGDIKASDVLRNAGLIDTYFPEDSRVYLEEAVPRTKINLSNSLTSEKFVVFLRNVYFGEVTEATTTVANQQVFGTKVVTDLSLGYKVFPALTFTVGANNLLDVYPDMADAAFGNRSDGRFDWSRRAQQFGIGGRFLFARVNFTLK
ncbi:TonB-dependent receptor [Aurantibacter crassamenti]|uniref:TonB-dependent receptor n=1 Tax=Aurantibacter crassamenti TaxID=1837375 RepID=UPI001939A8CF|nr:TonB-dependent receptor [Aurantibacter crassamenti]MBM1106908.1 TonB-dependent receptor [Aurantibacter crassamenti]